MNVTRWARAVVVGLGLLAGCGDDHSHDEDDGHPHDEYTEACQAIIDACHDVDDGSDPDIAECHNEWAHENVDAKCEAEGERCIGLCEEAAADAGGHDGGEHQQD